MLNSELEAIEREIMRIDKIRRAAARRIGDDQGNTPERYMRGVGHSASRRRKTQNLISALDASQEGKP